MKSLWNQQEAAQFAGDVGQRVYTSRLLGRDASLVLHGYVRKRPIPMAVRGVFMLAALAMAVPHLVIQYAALAVAAGLYFVLSRATRQDEVLVQLEETDGTDQVLVIERRE